MPRHPGNVSTEVTEAMARLIATDSTGAGYPRPQLRRQEWFSLDGPWKFAIDFDGRLERPEQVRWTRTIQVPFSPETPASGIHDTDLFCSCWYRRTFEVPPIDGRRLLLHFGAVDYRATVWVNDTLVAHHEGGYTPFTIDITDHVTAGTSATLTVRANDDPDDLAKPRGKQDWARHPHSIWYPRTSGIWQTVWLERAGRTRIDLLRWTPNLERWEIGCAVRIAGPIDEPLTLTVTLKCGGVPIAEDAYRVLHGEVHRRIGLSDPGIDDYRNEFLWNPGRPSLIDATLRLRSATRVLDQVDSYTALRAVAIDGDRFVLNGRPYYLRLVLDQGYWPDTGLTPPSDAAIRRDVELAKRLGFNGVRKHQKIEDPRFLYWADRLGLLVWEEMPSCYRFTQESIRRATHEWTEAILRDYSHPCIVTWVPFNESWGVPNLPMNAAERHYVHALYHLTKTLDPTRPVVGNDGWESVATDIVGIHDYDADPDMIARRYHSDELRPRIFKRERPGGRVLVLGDPQSEGPVVLTEFGGIALTQEPSGWGYSQVGDARTLNERYSRLMAAVQGASMFAGFCYTQFTDTYQETNGLLFGDRTPKAPFEQLAAATLGVPPVREEPDGSKAPSLPDLGTAPDDDVSSS
jgi:beta-galactosidase/beta-glucuronidase